MEKTQNISTIQLTQLDDYQEKPPPEVLPDDHGSPKYIVYSDKDEYDFVRERNLKKPTTVLESTGHLIKGCLGGGVLGIHEAYMKCGLWTALVVTVVIGLYLSYCIHILVRSAQVLYKRTHQPVMSYPDVAEASFATGPFPGLRKYSKIFRYTVDAIICIDLFGACCVYQIIIAKTIKQLVENTDVISMEGHPHLRIYIFGLMAPILLLCMITSLKYLAPFTLVGDGFIVACVIATVYYSMQSAPPISSVPGWKDAIGFFEFCGIVIFSMEGVGVSLPIENSMKDPAKFPLVLLYGMSVVITFVILVGFFGYWGFGEDCKSPVTLNFPAELIPNILKGLIGVMIFITYALNFWAPFNLCWHYLSKKHDGRKHWIWERVYRALSIVIITAVAVAFPNIGNLMGLLGAFCLSLMGFIFPVLIDLLVLWEKPGLGRYNWRLHFNCIIGLLGVLMFFAGTYSNVKGLIESF